MCKKSIRSTDKENLEYIGNLLYNNYKSIILSRKLERTTKSWVTEVITTIVYKDGVLIETYWNVNQNRVLSIIYKFKVLIETYWNVNWNYNTINEYEGL